MTSNDDKFILMNMDDERSKLVAEVLGNKTCKTIIDYLSEIKEAGQQDISKALGIPLNTVDYNLKKLIKSGLVEKTKNFFWSTKGRKIEMFKLARKHIIISPKMRPNLNQLRLILPILVAIVGIVVIALFLQGSRPVNQNQTELKHFNSASELQDFLNASSGSYGYYGGIVDKTTVNAARDMAAPATLGGTGESQSATSHSITNVQVQGVDEPDMTKNDGKYIYTISGNRLWILDAYPADNMNIVSETNISGIRSIFINNDTLTVFADEYQNVPLTPEPVTLDSSAIKSSSICYGCGGSSQNAAIYVYDIADRSQPKLEQNISVEGDYIDARMIGDYVYLISQKSAYAGVEPPVYLMNGVEKRVAAESVYYFDGYDESFVFNTITSLNVKTGEFNDKVYLTGYSGTIYVSQNSIYLAYEKRISQKDYLDGMIREVLPILPTEEQNKVLNVLKSGDSSYSNYQEASQIIQTYSDSLTGNEKDNFDRSLMDTTQNFIAKMAKESQKTIVHKIGVNGLDINYQGNGEVPGTVLNQFSMDEFNGDLRIATTVGGSDSFGAGGNSSNSLYVLDGDLKVIGKVEDIAQGEKIYSVRLLGDRGYIVTFKSVDPLFVIDLKNPSDPRVLGYLKIPGYSDYMQPYDETHIIGIGKDVNESIDADKVHMESAVYYTAVLGVKVSLFDVSDVEHPVEMSKFVIGDRGTDSLALSDHRAVLFDKEKGILVLPVSVVENATQNYYGYSGNWQGVYVFNISLDGITLRGKITHDDPNNATAAKDEPIGAIRIVYGQSYVKTAENSWELNNSYYDPYSKTVYKDEYMDNQPGGISYNYPDYKSQIQRSLYMDNVLYTVSSAKVKANNLDTLSEIRSVSLGYEDNSYSGYFGGISPLEDTVRAV